MPILARRILLLAFLLGIALPLASLPPFRLGYWDSAEPLVIGFHACAGLAALGLALTSLHAGNHVVAALRNPVAALPLALGAFSLLVAPLTQAPLLSALGAPQSGQGALWYLEFGTLIAAARVLRANGHWMALQRMAIVVVLAVAAIKGFDWWWERQGGNHLLIWVAAYYAWLGLALPAFTDDAGPFWRKLGWVAAIAILLAGRSIAAAAGAALAVALIATPALAGGRLWPRKAAMAIPLTALAAAPLLLLSVPALGTITSLADRHSLLMMVEAALRSWQMGTWLTGIGWGHTQDTFHANLASSGQVLWDNSWIFMSSDYFHSHTALAEALLATGLPGLLLAAAWFPAIVAGAEPGKRNQATALATALAVLSSLWFQLALSLPLTALALAALAPPLPAASENRTRLRLDTALLCATALAFLWAGLRLYDYARHITAVQADLVAGSPTPRPFPADPRGSDLAAAEMIRDAFWRMETLASPAERERALPAARMMVEHLSRRLPATNTILLPVTALSWQAQVQFIGSLGWLAGQIPEAEAQWGLWLDRTLAMAPARTDLAIPYLTRLAINGKVEELRTRTSSMLAVTPHDPVGLHFQGLLMVQHPNPATKQQGLETLRASVAAGIGRFMPLDPRLLPLLQ